MGVYETKFRYGTNDDSHGFFAISYSSNDTIIVSFRGTNPNNSLDLLNDITHGWTLGGGNFAAQQARHATAFLKTIALDPDNQGKEIVLTGHSLGGGLAGYLSALYGFKAIAFDPMPWKGAATNIADFYSMAPVENPTTPQDLLKNGNIDLARQPTSERCLG